ncbi:mercuric reductase [filamentous cyanobacterium LEGE 11480]|uniref:Mercuric reductase n=1 Tax=Romeriopsis navalis LEGE 11480 TaxID=2777977 RepID=A0A928VQ40_9CYAN|nr:mercuric reductase [Romeriopsis navalis]MBE9031692.1 mercuric reductase [Romeriopsis navalis LEGE 11480]
MPDTVTVLPVDQYNQTLVNHVHPNDWQNPTPVDQYDLVVIGAGTAGLVVAAGSAGLGIGLKIALIEKHLMGGDCLNVGCVPSKCLISSARVVGDAWDADRLGVHVPTTEVNFPAVMERMRKVRSGISHHDSVQRFADLGIDVYLGGGKFVDDQTVEVGGAQLKFKKAVIATGARAVRPNIPGLEAAGFLTNETVFSLTECPPRLAVIGGGPIGCELAQSFHRLGSKVVLLHKNGHILDKEDPDAAEIIQKKLLEEGMQLELGMQIQKVDVTPAGKVLTFKQNGETKTVTVDEILVGAGRQPNVESLNLEAIGVEYHPRKGVLVNDNLQTNNPKIYAAGDICMNWKFTHAADSAAQIVIKNALFAPFGMGKSKLSDLIMPWVTFTAPEVAHVGLYESQAKEKGIATKQISVPFSTVDRAIADAEETGFVKVLLKEGSDEILGATIVAAHAGEMISEITLAMTNKIGLGKFASVIHPYPTQAEAIKKAAGLYRKGLLTPRTKKILKFLNKLA